MKWCTCIQNLFPNSRQFFEAIPLDVELCSHKDFISLKGKANVKYWPFEKDWHNQGGKDDVVQPPIDLADTKAFYYRFKYNGDFGRFEHATEYKNNLKQLLDK